MTSSFFASPRFLPRVMAFDAAACAATGAVQLAAAGPLAALTGLPQALLGGTGVFLLAYALVVAWLARGQGAQRGLIGLVALGNLGWAAGCVALIAGGWLPLTGWGVAWLALQAVVVIVVTDLQWLGLRGTRGAARMAAA